MGREVHAEVNPTAGAGDGCSERPLAVTFSKGCFLASPWEGWKFSLLESLQDTRGEKDRVLEIRPKQINPKKMKISPHLLQTKCSFSS